MTHVTCDFCGQLIRAGEDHHYIFRFEVFAANTPPLTEDDLEDDHLETVNQMLNEPADEDDDESPAPPQQRKFDLCCKCRDRVVRDPLGKGTAQKLGFSKN